MKQLLYCLLLLVLSAGVVAKAAEPTASSNPTIAHSILLHVPGIAVEQYVPKNLLDLEKIVNPQLPGVASLKNTDGNIRTVAGEINPNQKILTLMSQSWDTIGHAWYTTYSVVNTYDAGGDLTETISQSAYLVGTPLTNSSRQTYTYNANHQVTETIYYSWSGTAWNPVSRNTQTYDGSNRITNQTTYSRSGNSWNVSGQTLYTYGSSKNPTDYIYQTWNGTAWVNSSKNSYVYTAWDATADYAYYSWVSNAWYGYTHSIYTYDGNHHLTNQKSQTGSGGSWTDQSQQIYTIDGNGDNSETLYQQWNGTAWVNNGRQVNTYDAFHNPVTNIYSNWVNNAWEPDNRMTYTYNAAHFYTGLLSESWMNNAWVGTYRWNYSLDAGNNITEYVGQQSTDGVNWLNQSRALYTWYGVAAGVSDAPALAAGYKLNANYPNPFNPSTKISYNLGKIGQVTLTVFDMLGREVATLVNEQQMPGDHEVSWNAASAASGLYYYQLSAGGFTLTKSMMLVK